MKLLFDFIVEELDESIGQNENWPPIWSKEKYKSLIVFIKSVNAKRKAKRAFSKKKNRKNYKLVRYKRVRK